MPETAPRLGRRAGPQKGSASVEGYSVIVSQLAARARFSLRLAASALPSAPEVAGFALDMDINRCRRVGERMAMRLGPDEWLLSAPQREAAAIAPAFAAALAGRHHALVDVSHARVALAVAGPAAGDVVNAGCPLDLSPGAFPAGHATRTLLGKAEIILSRPVEVAAFEVLCARSLASYVRAFLLEAAREFEGGAPQPPLPGST